MKASTFFTPLPILAILTTAVGVALPLPVSKTPSTNDKSMAIRDDAVLDELAVIQFYQDSECTLPLPDSFSLMSLETCYPVAGKTLEVLRTSKELKYNSLRVYNTKNCTGGWTLEPITNGAQCSNIETFHSINVVIE